MTEPDPNRLGLRPQIGDELTHLRARLAARTRLPSHRLEYRCLHGQYVIARIFPLGFADGCFTWKMPTPLPKARDAESLGTATL